MSQVLNIGDEDFEREVIQSSLPVVVDFGAEWCGPCKKIHPIMAELSAEMEGRARFIEIDVGKSPKTAQQYAVISVPQILLFKDGNVVERIIGVLSKPKLKEKIETHLNK